jgi:hypothetical protein
MTMAASVVTYTAQAEHADELTARVRQHLVPAARTIPGYRDFLLLDQGEHKRLALLLFDSIEGARSAQQVLSPVGEQHTYALMATSAIGSLATALVADGIFAPAASE